MSFKIKYLTILLITLSLLPGILSFEARAGTNVDIPSDTIIYEDFYISGGQIQIAGDITGDLVVAGGRIDIKGEVGEDAIIAGGEINFSGSIRDDARIAGGRISIDGWVDDDVFIAGGEVDISENALIDGDLVISAGRTDSEADVQGDVRINSGQVKFGGNIGGDVEINGRNIEILPNTVIGGNLNCTTSSDLEIGDNVQIDGEFTQTKVRRLPRLPSIQSPSLRSRFLTGLRRYLVAFGIGIILIVLFEESMRGISEKMIEYPWKVFLLGLLFVFVTPIVGIFLFITIIGIPFSLMLLILYVIISFLARIFVSLAIGVRILGKAKNKSSLILGLAIGLLFWVFLRMVPVVGLFVGFFTFIFGSGVLLSGSNGRKRKKGI
jgi:hypothetical protein